jgi:hypothetical protein
VNVDGKHMHLLVFPGASSAGNSSFGLYFCHGATKPSSFRAFAHGIMYKSWKLENLSHYHHASIMKSKVFVIWSLAVRDRLLQFWIIPQRGLDDIKYRLVHSLGQLDRHASLEKTATKCSNMFPLVSVGLLLTGRPLWNVCGVQYKVPTHLIENP